MGDLGDHGLDLPFEPTSGELTDEHVHMSGGLVVMAAVTPVPGVGPKPTLVFRFSDPFGHFYPAMVLIQDDDQIAKLRPLINQAIHAAREGAKNQPPATGAAPST